MSPLDAKDFAFFITIGQKGRCFTYTTFSLDVSRLKVHMYDIDVVASRNLKHMQSIQDHTATQLDTESLSSSTTLELPTGLREPRSFSETADAISGWTSRPGKAHPERTIIRAEPGTFNELVSRCTESKANNPQVRIEALALPLRQCDRFCLCQCHQVTNLATPNTLSRVLGRLFVGYIGLPLLSHTKCDRISCRQSRAQIKIRIAYLFPLWFALRLIALTITKGSTTFMWQLNFPVVTQTTAPMFFLTSLGNTEKVQALLGANAAFLNIIDTIASKSPLHVMISKQVFWKRLMMRKCFRLHFSIARLV